MSLELAASDVPEVINLSASFSFGMGPCGPPVVLA